MHKTEDVRFKTEKPAPFSIQTEIMTATELQTSTHKHWEDNIYSTCRLSWFPRRIVIRCGWRTFSATKSWIRNIIKYI